MYIAYDIVSQKTGRVRAIYHNPVPEQIEMESNGFYIESIPEAEEKPGFTSKPMVKIDTKEIYFDYVAIPDLPIDNTSEIHKLKLAVAELAETQEADGTKTKLALAELAELVAGGEK
ncbi:hypothetical protein M5X17_23490 [Paenibacillus alvei]|uniref:hypothetical protein n=1 Tax=Paenibacillus alvei TaxID=44250 RepID=UPI000288F943|nr:hypothetical protein [Paenibacillus alvei]EJW17008.1 hypothetical protein PAV_4c00870 [Paenibacillus alvei DSM 29]MCY9539120.1 hypothetical protein [Paenibacillus alvei]MCY9707955.1 hypothetical protein [Paenibacillus alvei]MCY9736686.1 hypothetical protein [Paenibacillus alvei]MEC0078776.1 hypothetical protein [Paenibacillus alvei]